MTLAWQRLEEVQQLQASLRLLEGAYDRHRHTPLLRPLDASASFMPGRIARGGHDLTDFGGSIISSATDDAVADLESRLVLSRLLLAVASIGSELISLRQSHPDGTRDISRLETQLADRLQTLAKVSAGGLDMSEHVETERTMSDLRDANVQAALAETMAFAVAGGRDGSLDEAEEGLEDTLDRETSGQSRTGQCELSEQLACHRLRLKYLKRRSAGKVELTIRRDNLLDDSQELILRLPTRHLRRRL